MRVRRRVLACNGEPVLNLQQMYALVQRLHASEAHLRFELQCVGGAALIAVETSTAEEVRDEIMKTYRVPAPASPELVEAAAEPPPAEAPRVETPLSEA